jgi:hypothetical protein
MNYQAINVISVELCVVVVVQPCILLKSSLDTKV